MFDALLFVCFVDEVNVDYSKLLKTTAAEGLRVEDLVKQYFEAAEQVQYCTHMNSLYVYILTGTHNADFHYLFILCIFLKNVFAYLHRQYSCLC